MKNMKEIFKNKKVVLPVVATTLLLSTGLTILAFNSPSKPNQIVALSETTTLKLETTQETTQATEMTETTQVVKEEETQANQQTPTQTSEVKKEQAQTTKQATSTPTTKKETTLTYSSQSKSSEKKQTTTQNPSNKQNTNKPQETTTKKETNNSNTPNHATSIIVKSKTRKSSKPDSYWIDQKARDREGRRVPTFKTMKEAFIWGEKHAENGTWYGLTGWETGPVTDEYGQTICYYSEMY